VQRERLNSEAPKGDAIVRPTDINETVESGRNDQITRKSGNSKTNNAYKFMSGIEGMDRFGTGPVRSTYFMLSSTELQTDFDSLTSAGSLTFLSTWNYPTNASALPSEYGSVGNIRILTSSEAPVARGISLLGNDIYYNTVLGKQALTHINQDGYSMNLIYRDPYYSGMLAQNATLAVKFAQAQAITQDTAIRNLLSTRLSSLGV